MENRIMKREEKLILCDGDSAFFANVFELEEEKVYMYIVIAEFRYGDTGTYYKMDGKRDLTAEWLEEIAQYGRSFERLFDAFQERAEKSNEYFKFIGNRDYKFCGKLPQ